LSIGSLPTTGCDLGRLAGGFSVFVVCAMNLLGEGLVQHGLGGIVVGRVIHLLLGFISFGLGLRSQLGSE